MKIEDFDELLESHAERTGMDWGLLIEVAAQCAWSATLRITPKPNAYGPDESTVLHSSGGMNPDDAVSQLAEKALQIIRKMPSTRKKS